MLIDTHAHLNDFEAYPDFNEIISGLRGNNVSKAIAVGSDYISSRDAVRLAGSYGNIYAAVGTHPNDAGDFCDEHYDYYEKMAKSDLKVAAIGEAGLDYHYEGYDKKKQAEVFIRHLELAHAVRLPIIIHLRDSFCDTVNLLKSNKRLLSYGGLLHCYSGSAEFLKEIFAFGLEISLGGTVTFKNAPKLAEVAKYVPLDKLHLETDCPYLAPAPHRGTRNEPKYINLVAEKIAEIKGITVEELSENTNRNAERLFYRIKDR